MSAESDDEIRYGQFEPEPTHILIVPHGPKAAVFVSEFVRTAVLCDLLVKTEVLTTRNERGDDEPIAVRAVAW